MPIAVAKRKDKRKDEVSAKPRSRLQQSESRRIFGVNFDRKLIDLL